jgi:equilibrative nucleoside transporter 1/2/3
MDGILGVSGPWGRNAVGMVSRSHPPCLQTFRSDLTWPISCRNMFLAAAPYFNRRFHRSDWAVAHYQSSILSVSTVTNLCCVLVLAKLQKNASYPRRIAASLVILIVVFTFLAISTVMFKTLPVGLYFLFVMTMVFAASFATGMNQNGVFAYVSGFGRPEYTQAIMAGQGIAGVLPCIVQILSVLAVPENDGSGMDNQQESSKSAFAYFMTATGVSALTLFSFLYLVKRSSGTWAKTLSDIGRLDSRADSPTAATLSDPAPPHQSYGLLALFQKLKWLALSVYLCFTITMVFPVFTAKIESVQDPSTRSRLFNAATFIPLAFLCWNLGDLTGRLSVLAPPLASLTRYPRSLFVFSLFRLVFIPMYLICNIGGKGATAGPGNGDFFYLVVVQFGFGLTSGFLGSVCMMGASRYVSVDEREAAGGFMSMMLVAGLATGSLLSFFVTGA